MKSARRDFATVGKVENKQRRYPEEISRTSGLENLQESQHFIFRQPTFFRLEWWTALLWSSVQNCLLSHQREEEKRVRRKDTRGWWRRQGKLFLKKDRWQIYMRMKHIPFKLVSSGDSNRQITPERIRVLLLPLLWSIPRLPLPLCQRQKLQKFRGPLLALETVDVACMECCLFCPFCFTTFPALFTFGQSCAFCSNLTRDRLRVGGNL